MIKKQAEKSVHKLLVLKVATHEEACDIWCLDRERSFKNTQSEAVFQAMPEPLITDIIIMYADSLNFS